MSYTEFISNYSLDNSQSKKGNDSKPKILDELLKENTSNNSPPKNIPLMSSKDKLKLRKDKHVLGHHHCIKQQSLRHMLIKCFLYPFIVEKNPT